MNTGVTKNLVLVVPDRISPDSLTNRLVKVYTTRYDSFKKIQRAELNSHNIPLFAHLFSSFFIICTFFLQANRFLSIEAIGKIYRLQAYYVVSVISH